MKICKIHFLYFSVKMKIKYFMNESSTWIKNPCLLVTLKSRTETKWLKVSRNENIIGSRRRRCKGKKKAKGKFINNRSPSPTSRGHDGAFHMKHWSVYADVADRNEYIVVHNTVDFQLEGKFATTRSSRWFFFLCKNQTLLLVYWTRPNYVLQHWRPLNPWVMTHIRGFMGVIRHCNLNL